MSNYFFTYITALALFIFSSGAQAATAEVESKEKAPTVRYKEGSELNFEKLLIQGKLEKPALTVVTGNVEQGADGLLRLRKDFIDHIAIDFGEEIESD